MPVSSTPRFRFTLRGLMAAVIGFAVALVVGRQPKAGWDAGPLAAVSVWIVLGLAAQVRDLWQTYHARRDLSSEVRWGWRFAAAWRVGLAALIVAQYVVGILLETGLLVLAEYPGAWPGVYESHVRSLCSGLSRLLLVIPLLSSPRLVTARPTRRWRSVVRYLFGGIAAVLLALSMWMDQSLVLILVDATFEGQELNSPGAQYDYGLYVGIDPNIVRRREQFIRTTMLAALFTAIQFVLIWLTARNWHRPERRRRIWTALTGLFLAATIPYEIWFCIAAVRQYWPGFVEFDLTTPWHVPMLVALAVVVVVTAIAHRLVSGPTQEIAEWRRRPTDYYHERRGVSTVAAMAILAAFAESVEPFLERFTNPLNIRAFLHWFWSFSWLWSDANGWLSFAVLLAALGNIARGWQRRGETPPVGPPRLAIAPFCLTWVTLFIAGAMALPVLIAFNFALWHELWFRLPWM